VTATTSRKQYRALVSLGEQPLNNVGNRRYCRLIETKDSNYYRPLHNEAVIVIIVAAAVVVIAGPLISFFIRSLILRVIDETFFISVDSASREEFTFIINVRVKMVVFPNR